MDNPADLHQSPPRRPATGHMSPPRSRRSSKPKRPPPVTPKRFTKFFTPRSSSSSARVTTSRSARQLRDITKAAVNRSSAHRSRTKNVAFEGVENNGLMTPSSISTPRKRKHVAVVSSSPVAASSPCKRTRVQRNAQTDIPSSPPSMPVVFEDEEFVPADLDNIRTPSPDITFCQPIRRLKRSNISLRVLERSFGRLSATDSRAIATGWTDPQYKSGNFYSSKTDTCWFGRPSLPFCTASCQTNNLVAAGTENGSVWLLDTTKGVNMNKPILKISPHQNAIMDLQFSEDDMTLATCGGDQTARLTDMRTQQVTAVFQLHTSSLKQVRFQPGDNNVIAGCSRDGMVTLWDIRCSGSDQPASTLVVNTSDGSEQTKSHLTRFYQDPLHLIHKAHPNQPHPGEIERRLPVGASVTSMSFLSAARNHLLITASESTTSLKVWDLRSRYSRHSAAPSTPVSSTYVPNSHLRTRHFGITSMAVDTNASTLYALSRDSTLYAYSTSHLILGQAPELLPTKSQKSRCRNDERPGLGPLYGLRHPKLRVSSFFVKCALRHAKDDQPEIIATGGSDSAAMLFSTDKRDFPAPIPGHEDDECPIYEFGTALTNGHRSEVSTLSWTSEGNLMSASDDFTVRCWREDGDEARTLRSFAREPGWRMETENAGWADVSEDFDECDDE